MTMEDFLIGDHNFDSHPVMNGGMRGTVPRDFDVQPRKMMSVVLPLIDPSEYPERIATMEKELSRLSDIRDTGNFGKQIPSLDQGQKGYCWAHSTTMAEMLARAREGLPYVALSAYAIACKIKNFVDEGAWGALSMDFAEKNGIPSQDLWPQGSMSRSCDNSATWADAAKHKVTKSWNDVSEQAWDRNLAPNQIDTLLLTRVPVVLDFNWWGHSVLGIDLVNGNAQRDTFRMNSGKLAAVNEFDIMWGVNTVMAGYGRRILNSWGNGWGANNGTAVLTGTKAIADGSVAALVAS